MSATMKILLFSIKYSCLRLYHLNDAIRATKENRNSGRKCPNDVFVFYQTQTTSYQAEKTICSMCIGYTITLLYSLMLVSPYRIVPVHVQSEVW